MDINKPYEPSNQELMDLNTALLAQTSNTKSTPTTVNTALNKRVNLNLDGHLWTLALSRSEHRDVFVIERDGIPVILNKVSSRQRSTIRRLKSTMINLSMV